MGQESLRQNNWLAQLTAMLKPLAPVHVVHAARDGTVGHHLKLR